MAFATGYYAFSIVFMLSSSSYHFPVMDGNTIIGWETKIQDNCTIAESSSGTTTWSGWIVVKAGDTISCEEISVSGTLNLILEDGARLEISAGLEVDSAAALNVYGQEKGSGTLVSQSSYTGAAIGSQEKENSGSMNFYGGTVEAYCKGDYNAAIGSGKKGDAKNISIYGGTIKAQTMRGGGGACIGSGDEGDAENIVIYGGTINCSMIYSYSTYNVWFGAGIGSGADGDASGIHIYGGSISTSVDYAMGIGYGVSIDGHGIIISKGTASDITINPELAIYDLNSSTTEEIVNNGGDLSATLKRTHNIRIKERQYDYVEEMMLLELVPETAQLLKIS